MDYLARASVGYSTTHCSIIFCSKNPAQALCGPGSLEDRYELRTREDALRHAPHSFWIHTGGVVGLTEYILWTVESPTDTHQGLT